jgi:hypothetical protein
VGNEYVLIFVYFLDNYIPGLVGGIPYCLPAECTSRLPLGDLKSCSLPDDTVTCYYKAPEVSCTEGEGEQCPTV